MSWWQLSLVVLLVGAASLWGCSGSDHASRSIDPTLEAEMTTAPKTPVTEELRVYARAFCVPATKFVNDSEKPFHDFAQSLEKYVAHTQRNPTPDPTAALQAYWTQTQGSLRSLREPMEQFVTSVKRIEPPPQAKQLHDYMISWMESSIHQLDAELAGPNSPADLTTLPTPRPTPALSGAFDAALLQECAGAAKLASDAFNKAFSP